MTPENIIECTKLYDYYTNGFGDGNSDHKPHIRLPKQQIQPKSSDTDSARGNTTHYYSAPGLMDLLNEENISPSIDTAILEQEWFDHPDPYDLAESVRIDAGNPDDARIERCSGQWKVASFVKLDSPALASLIKHLSGKTEVLIIGSTTLLSKAASVPSGKPDDWNMDEYL